METTNYKITPRYALLPVVSLLLKLIGYAVLVVAFVAAARTVISAGRTAADLTEVFLLAIQRLFSGIIQALFLIAASELIHVLLDIEENTRRQADAATGNVARGTPRL